MLYLDQKTADKKLDTTDRQHQGSITLHTKKMKKITRANYTNHIILIDLSIPPKQVTSSLSIRTQKKGVSSTVDKRNQDHNK